MTEHHADTRQAPFTALSLAHLSVFWREELLRLGLDHHVRALYTLRSPCPICKGKHTYQSWESVDRVACFCVLQAQYQEKIRGWQAYSALPAHLRNIERLDALSLGRSLTPTQRVQLSLMLKSVDHFIERVWPDQIVVGAGDTHGTILAAYIARRLDPLPNIYTNLSQLTEWLGQKGPGSAEPSQAIFYNIPVLIVDDFAAAYGEIDEPAAHQLCDLIDHRKSHKLPFVIVSGVPLDQLWAVRPVLLERLQEDADVYVFDHQQIRMRRPVSASPERLNPPAPLPSQRCRWLSMEDGSDTSSAFPIAEHHCRRVLAPGPITHSHQASMCLSADYVSCPVYQVPAGQPIDVLPVGILRQERPLADREPPLTLHPVVPPIVAGALLVVVVGGLMLFSEMSPAARLKTTPRTVNVTDTTPTPALARTHTSRSATPTRSTVTATMAMALSQETWLYVRPDVGAPASRILIAGTELVVLGRDLSGAWLRVETADGFAGWVDAAAIAGRIDVVALLVYGEVTAMPEMSTTAVTSIPTTGFSTALPTPSIPNKFTITLSYVDISGCDYPDLMVDYTFLLAGNRVTMTRVTDGTVLTGSFNPDTGFFTVSAAPNSTTEEISGRVILSDGWLEASGEHQIVYHSGVCAAIWMLSGRALLERSR